MGDGSKGLEKKPGYWLPHGHTHWQVPTEFNSVGASQWGHKAEQLIAQILSEGKLDPFLQPVGNKWLFQQGFQ